MAAAVPPDGVFVPVPTFFKPANGSLQPAVDVDAQIKHSIHLANSGITGLVLLGSTGEAIHLNKQERFDLVSGVRKGLHDAGFPAYPIMAGVLINGMEEVLEWLEDFRKAGAQWGLVLAPGYFGAAASQANLIKWYTIVADKSPLPILIYNYPGVTNSVMIEPESYIKLAAHPNIVGCKMSHGNVSYHVQMSLSPRIDTERFRVFSGFGQQLGPIVLFGAAGVIDGLASIYPKTVTKLFKLASTRPLTDEVLKQLQELQYIVSHAEEFVVARGIIGMREGIYRELAMGTMEGRLPIQGTLPEGDFEKWKTGENALAKISALERS